MGIMEDLRDAKKRPVKKRVVQVQPSKGIVSYRPTVTDKQGMDLAFPTVEEAIVSLEGKLEEGLKVTLLYNPTGHSQCAIVRDGNEIFGQGVAVAVNHRDLARCIQAIAYYLVHVNPDYPATPPQFFQQEFDW